MAISEYIRGAKTTEPEAATPSFDREEVLLSTTRPRQGPHLHYIRNTLWAIRSQKSQIKGEMIIFRVLGFGQTLLGTWLGEKASHIRATIKRED